MNIKECEEYISALERENRILKQKLARSNDERALLEEVLETHSNALKARNLELEKSKEKLLASEAKYRELAHHDILTGLSNRAFLYEQLKQNLVIPKYTDTGALLYMDLDRFKPVNDCFGHDVGDFVLCEVAKRLLACVRENDIVSRLGGDEFAVFMPDVCDRSVLLSVAEKIEAEISRPYLIYEKALILGASIGISIFPDDGNDPERLMQKADMAMYSAKRLGNSGRCFFQDIV